MARKKTETEVKVVQVKKPVMVREEEWTIPKGRKLTYEERVKLLGGK